MEKPKRIRKDDDGSSSSMDRISELPQPLLHNILCFLSQNEAVQTCLLSKSWRHLWRTRPILEFRRQLFRGNMKTFQTIFDQTLQRYHHQNLCIKRFVVDIPGVDLEMSHLLRKWIPIVLLSMGVETFHLISYISDYYYDLPSVVFQAQFLKELYLLGFKIYSTGEKQLCLKHLQTLTLNRVYIKDEPLEKILTSCPLIQTVDLIWCKGFTTVKVNSSNLKHFGCEVCGCNIEIQDPSVLETIKILYCLNLYMCNTNSPHFPRLKHLYLDNVHLPEEFSSSFSCDFACLEYLKLRNCSGVKEIRILSRSVKRLIIVEMLLTITIDAPSLLYFEFSSRSSVPLISVAKVASSEWKSNISVPLQLKRFSTAEILLWSLKLKEVLNALRQSQITLNLPCESFRKRHIKDINYAGCYEPVAVEHLNLRGLDSDADFGALFSCLFPIVRPRYIYTRMYPYAKCMRYLEINKLVEFLWKTKLNNGEFSGVYFWLQELKELSFEVLDHDSGQWCAVQECASTEIQVINNIRLKLGWRESALNA